MQCVGGCSNVYVPIEGDGGARVLCVCVVRWAGRSHCWFADAYNR